MCAPVRAPPHHIACYPSPTLVEFNRLKSLARQVNNANEDYRDGLLTDLGAEENDGEDIQLDQCHQADLEKTEAECGRRLDDVRKALQDKMWAQYGVVIRVKFLKAEAACDRECESPMCSKHLEQVTRLIQEASVCLVGRETWIPCKQMAHLKSKVAVEKLGACRRYLKCHNGDNKCMDIYLCRNGDCIRGAPQITTSSCA